MFISGDAVELSGNGRGVAPSEIRRVASLFQQLFGVEPRIRMTGRFDRSAIGKVPGGDAYVDAWDLRRINGSGYCDVLSVGLEYVHVLVSSGLNNNRAVALAPERGSAVKIRMLLPK